MSGDQAAYPHRYLDDRDAASLGCRTERALAEDQFGVIPIVVGVALVALGVHRVRQQYVPKGAPLLRGTVVNVRETRSAIHRKRTLYRPVIALDNPTTGRPEHFEPSEYGIRIYKRGDPVEVALDTERDRFVLRGDGFCRDLILIPGTGIVLIALQILDWLT